MTIENEIRRRLNKGEDLYAVIGAEIKNRRLMLSKTLSSLADKNCSISYLCKIEKNQVKPSHSHLYDICRKLDITNDKVNYLLNSRELLLESVKIFYYHDFKLLEKYYQSLEGLESHRIILIRLIFALTRVCLEEAEGYILKLSRLVGSLADLDLMLYATFYGVYLYYLQDYVNAADYFKLAVEYNISIEYIKPIQKGYLFMCALNTSSLSLERYYLELEAELENYGANLDLDKANYRLCLHYIMTIQYTPFKHTFRKIKDNTYKKSLELIFYVMTEAKEKIAEVRQESLNELARLFLSYYQDDNDFLERLEKSAIEREWYYYLKYLTLRQKDLLQAYSFLVEECFPFVAKLNLTYFMRYYLVEITQSIVRPNRYKCFFEMFNTLESSLEIINQI